MWNYAKISYDLYGPTKESEEVLDMLDELLAIQARLCGPDAPQTRATGNFLSNIQTRLNRVVDSD